MNGAIYFYTKSITICGAIRYTFLLAFLCVNSSFAIGNGTRYPKGGSFFWNLLLSKLSNE